jgi:hypothetical protein
VSAPAPKKRVAILISGRGSNMVSLIAAARAPDYPDRRLAGLGQRVRHGVGRICGGDHHHADAAVEGPQHLL